MGRMKKIVSFALSAALLSSVAITGASAAGAAYVKSDTTTNLTMQQGAVYQFKLTPVNTKQAVLISGNGKSIQVLSSKKTGNDYFVTIKAIGANGQSTGIYIGPTQKTAKRQLIVTIGASQNSLSGALPTTVSSISSVPSSPKPSTPTKVGSYGIIEAKDSRVHTEVGVLFPLQTTYNSASTYTEHRDNINLNLVGCDIIGSGFVKSGDGSNAFVRFIPKNGKLALEISAWRKSKDDNSDAAILNGALSAMVYLARSKPAGEALWAWHDAFSINGGHVDTKSYGFIDNPDGTITYKGTSNKIKIEFNPSDITFLFY
ncbi:exported protein of unknown function [Ruminococcaceae bacterium BL-6]|nr:exported protein of unknown function [Ruminococcaceae bacterium BL-6]